MVRRGTFRANWNTTENMCGITLSTNPTYNYICEIECGTVLDQHGFMIDQLDIDRYFRKKFETFNGVKALSCERMAIICCEDVKYMVESHMMKATGGSEIHRIAVTIFFNETTAMTAEWRASENCNTTGGKPDRKANGRQRKTGKRNSVSRSAVGGLEDAVETKSRRNSKSKRVSLTREEADNIYRYGR